MFGADLLYTALNVSSVTTLLDTNGLINGRMIPEWITGYKTINFYLSGPANGAVEYGDYRYSVNCRAQTDGESRAIAQAVFNQLNRADFSGYHTNCSVLGTLPPQDDTDVFNTPIEVNLKTRI